MISLEPLFIVFKYTTYALISATVLLVFILVVLKIFFEPRNGKCRCKTQLHGKTALVTGGSSGIGLETARDLARRGARVIIAARNDLKCKEAVGDIIATTGNRNVEYRHLNLSKFSSVREFVEEFNKSEDRLDILVNNAGCTALSQCTSEDGMDLVMQTNHFGPFLLTNLLTDKLIASAPSRIVIVSSCLHYFGKLDFNDLPGTKLKGWHAASQQYLNSKLCNVLWMKALEKRLPNGVTVNALHPGLVNTDILRSLYPILKKYVNLVTELIFKNAREGAQTSIHLSICPELEGVSGGYYKDCKPHPYKRICDDEEYVEKFWNKCVMLTSK